MGKPRAAVTLEYYFNRGKPKNALIGRAGPIRKALELAGIEKKSGRN